MDCTFGVRLSHTKCTIHNWLLTPDWLPQIKDFCYVMLFQFIFYLTETGFEYVVQFSVILVVFMKRGCMRHAWSIDVAPIFNDKVSGKGCNQSHRAMWLVVIKSGMNHLSQCCTSIAIYFEHYPLWRLRFLQKNAQSFCTFATLSPYLSP